jgi:hypothetical protein
MASFVILLLVPYCFEITARGANFLFFLWHDIGIYDVTERRQITFSFTKLSSSPSHVKILRPSNQVPYVSRICRDCLTVPDAFSKSAL